MLHLSVEVREKFFTLYFNSSNIILPPTCRFLNPAMETFPASVNGAMALFEPANVQAQSGCLYLLCKTVYSIELRQPSRKADSRYIMLDDAKMHLTKKVLCC